MHSTEFNSKEEWVFVVMVIVMMVVVMMVPMNDDNGDRF